MADSQQKMPLAKTAIAWLLLSRLIALGVLVGVIALLYFWLGEKLTLGYVAQQEGKLRLLLHQQPVIVFAVAYLIYSFVTGLSLPGAAVMSLAYGWFFGFLPGVILVSFASTTGATLAFLLSRYLFREMIQRRFGGRLKSFNEALDREGAFYLFTLRLIPAVPFFVINAVMGLTNMRVRTFWWVSQLGMLAGTCVYLYAGSTIPGIEQIADRSQLQAADVRDWPRLVAALQSNNDGPQAARIRALLNEEERKDIDELSDDGKIDDESKESIVQALNRLLRRDDFAVDPPARDVKRKPKQITMENRKLLENTFQGIIGSPRPILSWQLIVAFALLGVFPLLVRKIMSWVRTPVKKSQSPETTSP